MLFVYFEANYYNNPFNLRNPAIISFPSIQYQESSIFFMQNKANLKNTKMNISIDIIKGYENIQLEDNPQNKAKTKPIKANYWL